MKRALRAGARAAFAAAVFALAACGGGGGGGGRTQLPAVTVTTAPTASAGDGSVSFTVAIPAKSTASNARTPRFVSPSTASLTVTLQGASSPVATVNVTPGSPGCTVVANVTQCTVTANVPAGTDTLVVATYDGANGTGHELSATTIVATVTLNATNTVALALNGIVANATVILGTTSVLAGSAATVAVTVVGVDAAGNIIVGPGNYSSPVTLTNSDASGVTSLSTPSVAAPGTNVTLTYNGNSLNGATITPFVGGTAGTAATFTVTGYAFATYSVPASDNQYINALAAGPDGNLWYATDGAFSSNAIVGKMSPHGQVTEFGAGLPAANMVGLSAGSDGNMWFGDQSADVGSISPSGTVQFASSLTTPFGCNGSNGGKGGGQGEARSRRTQGGGPQTACGPVNWMVTGPDGNVWFADDNGLLGQVTPAGAMTEWAITALSGWPGGSSEPYQIAFGPDGNIYVADDWGYMDQIVLSGDVPASVTQVPLQSGCDTEAEAVSADGNIWFSDDCANVGMISPANFTSAGMLMWSVSGITNNPTLYYLIATPGGVWGTDDNFAVYRLTNLTGVSASTGPAVATVQPFGNLQQYPWALAAGPDGNVWVSENNYSPEAIGKIAYGAPASGALAAKRLAAPAKLGSRLSASQRLGKVLRRH